jgi:spore maturation protein CgeB
MADDIFALRAGTERAKSMNILYVGHESGTSGHRANALRRLGHDVQVMNPAVHCPKLPKLGSWMRYCGSVGLASVVRKRMLDQLNGRGGFDVVWVDSGPLVSRELVQGLKRIGKRVLNYNVDDPYGDRDQNLWHQYRGAVPAYDLVVVVRKQNVEEARALGARKVLLVFRSADEVAHAPLQLSPEEREKWASEVVFVGTAFPERGPFLAELVKRGVPLTIYGGRWSKLPEWKVLQPCWKGPNLDASHDYAAAIQCAKVCLGLLSRGNRDLHTTRSLETPSLGAVLCAERTEDHLALYEEDKEAVFWSSAEECAAKCRALLADEAWRRSVAENGRRRFLENGWTNMKVAEKILKAVLELPRREGPST